MIGCSAWKPAATTTTIAMTMMTTTTKKQVNKGGGVIECSSRPKKKGTSHHMKTRPKKTQPWDIRRKGPTPYPPLPILPPDWSLVSSSLDPNAAVPDTPPSTPAEQLSPSS